MASLHQPAWIELFANAPASSGFAVREFRMLRRHGENFLYLPGKQNLLRKSLRLYQPQTGKARLALCAVRSCLAAGLAPVLPKTKIPVGRESTLAEFLTELGDGKKLPEFAVLSGNPRAQGRRFVLLGFDDRGKETFVVKAACEPAGRDLIGREIRFLQSYGGEFPHIPKLLGMRQDDQVAAMALPFQPGRWLHTDDVARVSNILDSWFLGTESMAFCCFPQWMRFIEAGGNFPETFHSALAALRIKPVVFHGDFAPWNLRKDENGCPIALDWERGEAPGIAGWDWFHYIVQTSVLVRKEKSDKIYRRIVRLVQTPVFGAYARRAGFESRALVLFAAYLGYATRCGQSEGLETLTDLRNHMYAQRLP